MQGVSNHKYEFVVKLISPVVIVDSPHERSCARCRCVSYQWTGLLDWTATVISTLKPLDDSF